MKLGLYVCQREDTTSHKPASQQTDITDRMDNSFYSGAVNIGHLNLGVLVGNAMQIVGLHSLIAIRTR